MGLAKLRCNCAAGDSNESMTVIASLAVLSLKWNSNLLQDEVKASGIGSAGAEVAMSPLSEFLK